MRNRTAFRASTQYARLSDDVTKDNSDLLQKLVKHPAIESVWYFNCRVYAKLKEKGEKRKKLSKDAAFCSILINDSNEKNSQTHGG